MGTGKTKMEFLKKYELSGQTYEKGDRVEVSDVGITINKAEELAKKGVIKLITQK